MYDVRVRRELAHRRFAASLFRQAARLITLHALDATAIALAFVVSRALSGVEVSARALPAIIAFFLVGLNLRASYRAGNARRDGQRIITGALIGIALTALPGTLPFSIAMSGEFLALLAASAIAALILERRAVDLLVRQAYVRGYGLRRALVVARAQEFKDVRAGLEPPGRNGMPEDDHVIVGYVNPDIGHDGASLGSVTDIERILEERDVSELLIATSLRNDKLSEIADACFELGVRVLVIPPAPHSLRGWAELTHVGVWPAYQLHPARLELPSLILKRATDLVLASVATVLSLPLFILIAIAIKAESRGPVLFRQRRAGLGGREFMMWKFRSMTNGAEARQSEIMHLNSYEDARLFKMPGDPRITRVGRVLRRFSLDELPQLFNILAGDMSLVGPRPPLPSEVSRYETRHYVRLSVVPGLTGPWQVNGRNLITDFEEVVRLEQQYIEKWSLRSDIEIMLRTLGVVLSGKGAY